MTDTAAIVLPPIAAYATTPTSPIARRHVAAALIGNGLEMYDFTIYAYFAIQIGHAFFPNKSGFISLILSLATFGAGFVLRPIGAVVLGRYADRMGRRPAMLVSLTFMGVGILGLALTPGYAQIGLAAPILVVVWRLCQGFALGGEVGPTTAYLVEAAPPARRGFYAAWQAVSQGFAFAAGGLVGLGLGAVLGIRDLDDWGWRIAFLLGALILPVGLYLRRSLPETLHVKEDFAPQTPAGAGLGAHARIIALGLAFIASGTVYTYALTFMTVYARGTLHLSPQIALAAPIVNGAAAAVFALAGGWLCDRFGRKPLLIWPRLAFLLAVVPLYVMMTRYPGAASLLGGTAVMSGLGALSGAAFYAAINEALPKAVRAMIFGGVYAVSVAIFGGTTQPVLAWLIHVTGDPVAPAWYVMAFAAVGLIAGLAIRETAPTRTAPRPAT